MPMFPATLPYKFCSACLDDIGKSRTPLHRYSKASCRIFSSSWFLFVPCKEQTRHGHIPEPRTNEAKEENSPRETPETKPRRGQFSPSALHRRLSASRDASATATATTTTTTTTPRRRRKRCFLNPYGCQDLQLASYYWLRDIESLTCYAVRRFPHPRATHSLEQRLQERLQART